MKKILSIIVPVYNVEAYLKECLDSIFQQNLEDFEVICVNDGSSDNSRIILDEFKDKYHEIIIIDRENGGLSAARNSGLEKASGEYIFFLDSDDYLLPDTLKRVVNYADQNQLEVAAFSAVTNGNFEYPKPDFKGDNILSGIEYYNEYYKQCKQHPFSNVWLYLYSKAFLDKFKLEFRKGPYAYLEDVHFSLRVFFYVQRISFLSIEVVFYRKFRTGALSNENTLKRLQEKIMVLRELYFFFIENNNQHGYFYDRISQGYKDALLNATSSSVLNSAQNNFTKLDIMIMRNCAISRQNRKMALLASINPRIMHNYYYNILPTYGRRIINIYFSFYFQLKAKKILMPEFKTLLLGKKVFKCLF